MRQHYGLLCLLLLFISGYQAQDPTPAPPEWNGDPQVCVVNPPPTPPPGVQPPPFPKFTTKAEFALERVETKYVFNQTLPSEMTLYEYIYDYDANKLIMVKNKNGFIDVEYYYYGILKKSTYYAGQYCVVADIPQNTNLDGASAIQLPDGTWHVRPLNEFLLFSSDDPNRLITPIYLGKGFNRGIAVDKWQSCYIDRANYRTVRREWSFAQRGISTTVGVVGDLAVPVHASIISSQDFPNGTQIAAVDEVFNVLSYRPYILETATALSPPKGVFCSSGPGQNLSSLEEVGIEWPNRFSVRVEASTSRTTEWQRFHLRYDNGRDGSSRRFRYDYMPPGAEDYQSVIHDYGDNLTYIIDRRLGSCQINRGVEVPDVDPIRDPIRFFIKNVDRFIYNPPPRAWEHNGFRACRGNNILCTILTSSVDNFPDLIDIDTGRPTGEKWAATNIEYAWSRRSPFARPPGGRPRFDYPVSIFLKLFRYDDPNNPSPANIRTEDIEYEFYEMSYDSKPSDFDISTCYRSLDLPYFHLGFVLKPGNDTRIDNKYLDRRVFEQNVKALLVSKMQVIWARVSNVQIDYIRFNNSFYVLFTLLGPTPLSNNDEPSIGTARQALEMAINADQFTFSIMLVNYNVEIKAQPNSLKAFKQFMSIHASSVYANVSNCNVSTTTIATTTVSTIAIATTTVSTTTIATTTVSNCPEPNVNNSYTITQRIKQEKYTSGAIAGGIIGGLIVGIVLGFISLALIHFLNKKSTSDTSSSIGSGLSNKSFRKSRPATPMSMQNLQDTIDSSHT